MKKKIVFIGAGSATFTRKIVNDILSYPSLSDSTIALVDINPENLDVAKRIVTKIIDARKCSATIVTTTDRKQVLEGADGVVCTIQVGSQKQIMADYEIPKKYGININVGDTRGPSGIFRFLRTAPVMLDICRDIEKYCPDAVFCNYTNPMSMLCRLMMSESKTNVVGLCHSIPHTQQMLARWLEIPHQELDYVVAGINHQAWFLKLTHNGRDMFPKLREIVQKPEIANEEQVRNEMFNHLGYYVTESSGHNSEYNWWFRKTPELIERFCTHGTGWNPGAEWVHFFDKDPVATKKQNFETWLNEPIDLNRSTEYISHIFNATIGDGALFQFTGNVRNFGLIDNLPTGSVVEVPVLAEKSGLKSVHIGELPKQLAALNAVNCFCDDMAVEGEITGDPQKIMHAITYDPLTAAVLGLDEIRSMVREMFEASKEWLPKFKI